MLQVEHIGHVVNQAAIHELFHQLVTQSLHVQRAPRAEVTDGFLALSRAHKAAAAAEQDVAIGLDGGTAGGTKGWHQNLAAFSTRTVSAGVVLADLHHLGNDIACAADDHAVANAQAQARNLGHVVQRGIAHGDTAHEDRLQPGYRGNGAGAAYLELHVPHLGGNFLGGELVGHCPARRAGVEAQLRLQLQPVHLDHGAIDLVVQPGAFCQQRVCKRQTLRHTADGLPLGVHHEPPLLQAGKRGRQRLPWQGICAVQNIGAIAEHAQRARRGDARVELTQGAGSGIAGIHEGLAARSHSLGIGGLEAGTAHVDLAAHFQTTRHSRSRLTRLRIGRQTQRHITDGAHVVGDVLAGHAVATGRGTYQQAIFVKQADGNAIDLGLAAVDNRGITVQTLLDAGLEVHQIFLVEHLGQGHHRHGMTHLHETAQRRTTNPLGRRIGGDELGILRLKLLQLREQAVVFHIGNFRSIEGVIQKIVVADLPAQLSQHLQDLVWERALLWEQALLWERALPANLFLTLV